MPAILTPDNAKYWLDSKEYEPDILDSILLHAETEYLISYPVSNRVNSNMNDDSSIIDEVHLSNGNPQSKPRQLELGNREFLSDKWS